MKFLKKTVLAGIACLTLVTTLFLACNSKSKDSASDVITPVVPVSTAWSFGVMADTQWVTVNSVSDDGNNPNTVAVDVAKQVQQQFITKGVKFVVQVGDLSDAGYNATTTITKSDTTTYTTTKVQCEDTRALFAQSLYNAGIGFYPLRGNHDDASSGTTLDATDANEFIRMYPQTQNGGNNNTPSDVFSLTNPDSSTQANPAKTGSTFNIGSNFSSPSTGLSGLSYSFDYNNARFVFIDQFCPTDSKNADGTAWTLTSSANAQNTWINTRLAGKASGSHAFVFSHKGLITENHTDVLFGANPSSATGQDTFITNLQTNGVRYFFCGHDHMHDRSRIYTTDGSTNFLTQIVCASDSNKFYVPTHSTSTPGTSNDDFYCAGKRQVLLEQELYTVGYYIVTVDGSHVTVDFYSAPITQIKLNNSNGTLSEVVFATTGALQFTKRSSFGYSLNGKEFVVAQGTSYTGITDTSADGTAAKVLSGTNANTTTDMNSRKISVAAETGWIAKTTGLFSDILKLSGMAYTFASAATDTFTLSLSYTGTPTSTTGGFGLLTLDSTGTKWVNAVNNNSGGTASFVNGPWNATYGLGTYGIDPATNTAWAVVNSNGLFAVGPIK